MQLIHPEVQQRYDSLTKLYHQDIVIALLRLSPLGGYVATGKRKDRHRDIIVLLRYEFGPKKVAEWEKQVI